MANELCDQKDCSERATHAYTWEWGQSGTACPKHQMTMNQTAGQLGRTIQFAPISDGATPPLQREERVKLKAEALVLAEELEETKARGLDLYRQNTQLIAQVQSLTVRNREAEAQARDAVANLQALEEKMRAYEAENGTLVDELSRLRVLVELPPDDAGTSPHAMGLTST